MCVFAFLRSLNGSVLYRTTDYSGFHVRNSVAFFVILELNGVWQVRARTGVDFESVRQKTSRRERFNVFFLRGTHVCPKWISFAVRKPLVVFVAHHVNTAATMLSECLLVSGFVFWNRSPPSTRDERRFAASLRPHSSPSARISFGFLLQEEDERTVTSVRVQCTCIPR